MQNIDEKLEHWKKLLLDLGKRNRLINFKETKRSNLLITSPSYDVLYERLVQKEELLAFPYPQKVTYDEEGNEINSAVHAGDIETNRTINEQQKTLKALRSKAKTSMEEQGVNILYLTFGLIKWKESDDSDLVITSPLVLVPVTLTIESITDPYLLQIHEDEIVINPNLAFKFENDFGIILPEFDGHEDSINEYINKVSRIARKNDWEVTTEVSLSLLSFLKINMYKDLEENKEKIISNPIIKAVTGDNSGIEKLPDDFNNFEHDKRIRPIDTFQVVDADSSQQDAILLSKKGISFVLQGPPGTGKSQTITNIIAEAIADGKKVLFVSEKMAALEIVKKRLSQSGLEDFCLAMHSHKVNKKDILNQLGNSLSLRKIKIKEEAIYKLSVLEEKRNKLNQYQEQVHTPCAPLNKTIYEANGELAKLFETGDIVFEINDVDKVDLILLNKYKYLLSEFSKTIGRLSEDYSDNPWYGCSVPAVTHELRHNIEVSLNKLIPDFRVLLTVVGDTISTMNMDIVPTIENIDEICEVLDVSAKSTLAPEKWLAGNNADNYYSTAQKYKQLSEEYRINKQQLLNKYQDGIFGLSAKDIIALLETNMAHVKEYLNDCTYKTLKDVVISADDILTKASESERLLNEVLLQGKMVTDYIGIDIHETIGNIINLNKLVVLVLKNPRPARSWYDNSKFADIFALMTDAEQVQSQLLDNLQSVTSTYQKDILNVEYNELLRRFNNEYTEILEIISHAYGMKAEDGISDYLISSFINNQIKELHEVLSIIDEANISAKIVTEIFGLTEHGTLKSILKLSKLVQAIAQAPKPTSAWFDTNRTNQIEKLINEIKSMLREIEADTELVLSKYNKDIFNIDFKQILFRFNTEYNSILKYIKGSYKKDKKVLRGLCKDINYKATDADITAVLNKLLSISDKKQWLSDHKATAHELLGDIYMEEYTDWDKLSNNRDNFAVVQEYFIGSSIPDKIKSILIEVDNSKISPHIGNLVKIEGGDICKKINDIIGKNVDSIDISTLLGKIKTIIDLSMQLKANYDLFKKLMNNKNRLDEITQIEIADALSQTRIIHEKRQWINDNQEKLELCFGKHCAGESTDWNRVRESFDVMQEIRRNFTDRTIPKKLMDILDAGESTINTLIPAHNSFNKLIDGSLIETLNALLKTNNNESISINSLLETIQAIKKDVSTSQTAYESFSYYAKESKQFDNIISDIILLDKVQTIENTFDVSKDELQYNYEDRYKGIETDWTNILNELEWARKLKEKAKCYSLSKEYIQGVCQNPIIIKWAREQKDSITSKRTCLEENFKWYSSLFDEGSKLYKTSLFRIMDRIEKCRNNLSLLEEWIDFRSIREKCRDAGLREYTKKVEEISMNPDLIVNTFLKRFYRLWLDAMIPQFPAVYSFRSRSHESLIKEFKELDKLQLDIARLRIKERLIDQLPDTSVATAAKDEVGILKRELIKQRKIMPLRKLFKLIPNLLTALKPCLMMSPLSVSLFLKADGYDFDLVIFDEASQVCTEDAIGAIMRGKQVVIAGDSKQLPPTSFFATTLSDNDFDTDADEDDYDDTGAYDSILEEALNGLLERTLKWHYRSRHEHLIAFSNAKIYNHDLITFPSNIDKVADNGVEYIYVSDGVYERGGKKHNINEAKRVAQLVFEHFRKYPNRSIGVVTFSEAQQQAVDNAIRQLRLQKPQYEKFFDEENEEAFFVKNLENVQGDERDTIIFSIGYAKDPNGVMYMNFGPLSRNGGYRRLNVAITRAKYNVKLVGSIHPTDINLENTSAEGVRMLRSYIEFAINGPSVLQNELHYKSSIKVESTFEEAVYDFIVKNGYNVVTQVGCSGYRIDLAVKHPTLSGRFVLGVECDGATYHSARTARERDRLRQTVLEDIGWKIYRIWSTDWVKDPITEGNKLLEAIRVAIANYRENDSYQDENNGAEQKVNIERLVSEASVTKESRNPYGFKYYHQADIWSVTRHPNDIIYVKEIIKHVVNIEYPIHFENLCKRVAPIFGNQKATVKVKNYVESVMPDLEKKKEVRRNGDFIWPYNVTEVPVRISEDGEAIRPINYISIEELAYAMKCIVNKSYGIAPDDLIVLTAREFGFNRAGINITLTIQYAYEYLLKHNMVKEVDSKVISVS